LIYKGFHENRNIFYAIPTLVADKFKYNYQNFSL